MSEKQKPEIRILTIVNILNTITVAGEDNIARFLSAIRELRSIADDLYKDSKIQDTMQAE